jgi:hypothetical protein
MVDFSEARLAGLAVHKVGNKLKDDGILISEKLFELDETIQPLLEDFFFKSFKKNEYFWQFTHETDLSLNEVYTFATAIFDSKRSGLLAHSISMLKHLYAQSTHPNVKSGELYVAWITDCIVEGELMDAVGIFKSENKEAFLHFDESEQGVEMNHEQGVNLKKLDKGALIFNTFADEGYSLLMVDGNANEAQYWRDDFLKIQRIEDDSYYTERYLDMCQDFVEEVFAQEESKKDQVVFMNSSINYFAKNKEFDSEDFKVSILSEHPKVSEVFTKYQSDFEEENGLTGEEGFRVSRQVVREAKRKFKSLIKLDTGVEIKIDRKNQGEYIERGFDNQLQMGYYKVYFNKEE